MTSRMSVSRAACAVSCLGTASSSSIEPVIANGRMSRSASARRKRALHGRAGSALVAELAVRERGQQVRLDDGHISDHRRFAAQNTLDRGQGGRRVAFGEADGRARIVDLAAGRPAPDRALPALPGPR